MRKLPAVLVAAALVALTLSGCSAGSTGSALTCARAAGDAALGSLVTASGAPDSAPDVTIATPLPSTDTAFADLATGDGTTIVSATQEVVLGMTVLDGSTGEQKGQVGYNDLSNVRTVGYWEQVIPGFSDALMCARAGSRVVASVSANTVKNSASSALNFTPGAAAVFVIDVRKVYLSAADGALQFNDARGLPTVVRAPSGQPGVIVPDAPAPSDPVVQVLKKGSGAVPGANDTVRVNFTTVAWDTRKVTKTSWGSDPVQVDLSAGGDPVTDALAGQPVGSQVMVVVPAGAAGSGTVAQVIVLDVLGVDGQPG